MISRVKLNKLQKLQNKCVQLIDPNIRVEKLFIENSIPKLDQMIQIECCKLWQRHYLKLLPTKPADLMSKDSNQHSLKKNHRYGTRNKNVLNTPLATNSLYRNSFFVNGLTKYQKISQNIRNLKDIELYTKALKRDIVT